MSELNGKVLSLGWARKKVAGRVEFGDGVEHEVLRFNAEQYQRALRLQTLTDPIAVIEESVQILALVMPSLPAADIRQLQPEVYGPLILLAMEGVELVEKAFPNAESPEPPTSPG